MNDITKPVEAIHGHIIELTSGRSVWVGAYVRSNEDRFAIRFENPENADPETKFSLSREAAEALLRLLKDALSDRSAEKIAAWRIVTP